MPRISTDNYDTVASWNGSQDLFVVEQPDGTKVATPAMVKQFIEAGDFVATGEIKDGHGNILKDMAKSVDVANEIGDLSQTGLTGDSVAEQLGTAREQLNVEELSVSDGTNTSLIGIKFNGIIFFAGSLLRVTTTANTWVDTNTTHNMILTRNLEVAIWSAATGDWSGFAKFGTDRSVKVYAKYSGNFIPNLLGTVKL